MSTASPSFFGTLLAAARRLGGGLSGRKDLERRVARPTVTGMRTVHQQRSIVTDLTPDRLRFLLQSIAQGVWCPEWWELAEELEEKDLHYRGVLQQRCLKSAVSSLDVRPASAAARDVGLAEEVRERVLEGPHWHDMLLDLLDAVGKGVSCQEIVWTVRRGRVVPAAYHRIDPRWLVWDRVDGETPYLVSDERAAMRSGPGGGIPAEPLPPNKFVYHRHRAKSGLPGRGGLAYAVATVYLLRSLTLRDWWAFGEVYGLPVRIGKYGPDASDADIRTLEMAVGQLAADAGCVIPDSMSIDLLEAMKGGGMQGGLFTSQVAWCEAQVSKAVVGQTMTSDDGASLSQARVHADVRDDLVADDVRQMCGTLTTAIVEPYCRLNHVQRPAGWPRIAPPPEEEAVDVAGVTTAATRGLRVPAKWMRERMGVPEPRDGEEVLSGLPVGGGAAADKDARPPAAPGLHAADDPLGGGEWFALGVDLTESVLDALDGAADADDFLRRASASGASEALAQDLARRCFEARVDGEA